jgi:hypothetical protein
MPPGRYLDVRTLLSEEEKIDSIFLQETPHLGFMDPQCRTSHLAAQTKVPLPLWLAESMAEAKIIEVEMPKYLNTKMREAMMAGPIAIDIRAYSFQFFETGLKLSYILNNSHLKELRVMYCGERYKRLVDIALTE